jgi:hypothetical protein
LKHPRLAIFSDRTAHKNFWTEALKKKGTSESLVNFLRRKWLEEERERDIQLREKEKEPAFTCHCPVCTMSFGTFKKLG